MNSFTEHFAIWRLFALEPERLAPLERTLLWTALLVGFVVFIWTFLDVRRYAGDDLRNRVVGARVMLIGEDPYTFRWHEGMPEELLDPVYDPKAHRLTLSPPALLLYAIASPLSYPTQRFLHFLAEWIAMVASLILLARSLPELRQRVVLLLGATLFVIATDVWRMHLERGQVYVFYLLALSVAVRSSRCGRVDSIATGLALGMLALMRPNMLAIAPALLIARQWRAGGTMLACVGVGFFAATLMLPLSSWPSYLDVGEQYFRSIQDHDSIPDLPRPERIGWVEETDFGQLSLSHVESSSFAVLHQTLHQTINLPSIDLSRTSKLILAAIAASLLALTWLRRGADRQETFALIVVLSLDTEFFLPHRWGYADVMLLAPLALLLPELLRPERTRLQILSVVMLGLVCGPMGQLYFGLYAATVLRSWLVMAALTLLVISIGGRRTALPE